MKRILYAASLLLGLAACHSQTNQTATTEAAPAPQTTATDQPAAAGSSGTSYRVFRGLLPGQADSITLNLVTAPQPRYDTHGPSSQGSYYGPDGHPYELASQPSAPDSLVLNDYSPEHGAGPTGQGPTWRLKRQPDGGLVGTVGNQAVRLRPMAPAGGLTFAVRCVADSLAAFPNQPASSPKFRLYMQALLPVGGPASVQTTLAANMLRELRGDTLANLPPLALPALFKQRRDTLFRDYHAETAELAASADTADLGTYRGRLSYEDQTTTYVLCHQGNLLSLATSSYSYSGGAHGMNGTTTASYDLRTGRRLRYDDIFLPTAQAQLPTLLAQAVRPLVGLKPGEPLDKELLVSKLPVTHNVFLTPGGVEFVYQPYEIASYAQGEVRVFLPLSAVRSLLREGLPLPGSSPVAAR